MNGMKEYFKKHQTGILLLALIAAATTVLYASGIGCVWRHFLHFDCPGCGMSRAWLALSRGDPAGAFLEYPMFWSLPLILWLIWENGRIFKKREWNLITVISLGVMLLINYIFRLIR